MPPTNLASICAPADSPNRYFVNTSDAVLEVTFDGVAAGFGAPPAVQVTPSFVGATYQSYAADQGCAEFEGLSGAEDQRCVLLPDSGVRAWFSGYGSGISTNFEVDEFDTSALYAGDALEDWLIAKGAAGILSEDEDSAWELGMCARALAHSYDAGPAPSWVTVIANAPSVPGCLSVSDELSKGDADFSLADIGEDASKIGEDLGDGSWEKVLGFVGDLFKIH